MKRKLLRVVPLVALVGLLGAIPATTQIIEEGESAIETNLPVLIAVNRLEMSTAQMETLHEVLMEILDLREDGQQLATEFEAEMIAFDGSEEELDEILAAHRERMSEQMEALRTAVSEAIETMKDTLSIRQGEIIEEQLEGLLERPIGERAPMGLRERLMEYRAEGAPVERPMLERLQQMEPEERVRIRSSRMDRRMEVDSERRMERRELGAQRERLGQEVDDSLDRFAEEAQQRLPELIDGIRERYGDEAAQDFQGLLSRFGQGLGRLRGQVEQRTAGGLRGMADRLQEAPTGDLERMNAIRQGMGASEGERIDGPGPMRMRILAAGSERAFSLIEDLVEILERKLEALQ